MTKSVDVVVIGAGPSGCVAASYLADRGYKVAVFEKAVFPRFVIGESLLPVSMGHWEEAGILPRMMEQNYAEKRIVRFVRGDETYDLPFRENFTDGWSYTWQVPRAHFDNIAAEETQKKGVSIHFGYGVESADLTDPSKVIITGGNGTDSITYEGRFLIDSSGYGGTMVKLLGLRDERNTTNRQAFFTHVTETDEMRSRTHQPMQISFEIMATDLWFWIIPFSNGVTSLGFVGDMRHFDALDGVNSKEEAFNIMIKRSKRFKERFEYLPYLFEPHIISEYAHYNEKLYGQNYVLTGNCAGFLDPVFSSGVAFATESGLVAAKLLDKQLKGAAVDWETDYSKHIRWGAAVFRSYIDAWYNGDLHKIFFSPKVEMSIKQQIVSVLAGYVWDMKNPMVSKHHRILRTMARVVELEAELAAKRAEAMA